MRKLQPYRLICLCLSACALDEFLLDLLSERIISAVEHYIRSLWSHALFNALNKLRNNVFFSSDLINGIGFTVSKLNDWL